MTSQSSGGSGSGLPGVTTDGKTPGGEVIAGGLTVGSPTPTGAPSYTVVNGFLWVKDTPGNAGDFDPNIEVDQIAPLTANNPTSAIAVIRAGPLNGFDYTAAALDVTDSTASAQPAVKVTKGGVVILELTGQRSITGALSSVIDANAKAVLTSIIAALVGIKVATNNTT